jgi:hypothetical protein
MITNVSNIIVGSLIVIINLIPIVLKKYKYILLTSLISLLLILLLKFVVNN